MALNKLPLIQKVKGEKRQVPPILTVNTLIAKHVTDFLCSLKPFISHKFHAIFSCGLAQLRVNSLVTMSETRKQDAICFYHKTKNPIHMPRN